MLVKNKGTSEAHVCQGQKCTAMALCFNREREL